MTQYKVIKTENVIKNGTQQQLMIETEKATNNTVPYKVMIKQPTQQSKHHDAMQGNDKTDNATNNTTQYNNLTIKKPTQSCAIFEPLTKQFLTLDRN